MQGDAVPLPEPEFAVNNVEKRYYTADQLRTYGDSRAEHARREAMEEARNLMFDIKGCKVTRFDAQSAIRRAATKGATPPGAAQGDGP